MRRYAKTAVLVCAVLLLAALAGCSFGSGAGRQDQSFGGRIVGIEPGAGIMSATERAIDVYNLDYELQDSSSFAMAAALRSAIENNEWIVVTGWSPHWKFAEFDLKFLDDPEGVYGAAERIETIVRQGLKDDDPALYTVLDRFRWGPNDIGAVMLDVSEGVDPAEAARRWVDENQDKVAEWTEGVEAPAGGTAHLAFVEWDCAIASTNVVATVLEDLGYDVQTTSVDAGIMWQGVANGSFDGMTTAWLPATHAAYYEEVQDQVENLGSNFDGEARIGLVVPAYVTIDSITELNDHK